jgi:phosphoribosylaminoimidazole (AIR) synthetase
MGIGMVLAVAPSDVKAVLENPVVTGFEPVIIGSIVSGDGTVILKFPASGSRI